MEPAPSPCVKPAHLPRLKLSWVAFVAVLAVAILLWIRWSVVRGNWADLDVYVRGAHAILQGAPLYEQRAGVLPFTYSPFAAVLFTPIHLLSSTMARWIFTAGSLVSYLVVVGVCGRRLRLPWRLIALVAERRWRRAMPP